MLSTLPPKTVQDVFVTMSATQQTQQHTIRYKSQSQQLYLRRLLLHSRLVLSGDHPLRRRVVEQRQREKLSLHSLSLAPKRMALLWMLRRVD